MLSKCSGVCENCAVFAILLYFTYSFPPISIFCDGCPRQIGAPYAYSPSVSHPYGKPIVWVRQKKNWNQRLRHIEPRLALDKQTWLAAPFSEHDTGIVTLIGDGDFKGYYKIEKEGRIMLTLDRPLTISLPGLGLTKNLFHALCIVVEKKVLVIFVLTSIPPPPLGPNLAPLVLHLLRLHTHIVCTVCLLCSAIP